MFSVILLCVEFNKILQSISSKLIYRKPLLSVPWGTDLTTQFRDCSKSPGGQSEFPREITEFSS